MIPEKELFYILRQIKDSTFSEADWAEHASSDWFQTDNLCGGFECIDNEGNGEFTFSLFPATEEELWFSIKYNDIDDILRYGASSIALRKPN